MKLYYHITERLMGVGNNNKNVYIFLFHKQYIFDCSVCFLMGERNKGQSRDYGKFHVYSTLECIHGYTKNNYFTKQIFF